MYLEFFTEELSAEVFLRIIVPKILPDVAFEVHPFQGKTDLLQKLPARLRALAHWIQEDHRIVVIIDEDRQDCAAIKAELEGIAAGAGLITRTQSANKQVWQVLNRIAIEELEAWMLGDAEAVCAAYPRVPNTFPNRQAYRDPDAMVGGTWEALERLLQRSHYHVGGLRKLQAAEDIAEQMDPGRNESHSFCVFRDALLEIAELG